MDQNTELTKQEQKFIDGLEKFAVDLAKRRDRDDFLITECISRFDLSSEDILGMGDIARAVGQASDNNSIVVWFKALPKEDLEHIAKYVYNSVLQFASDIDEYIDVIQCNNDTRSYYQDMLKREENKVVALTRVSYNEDAIDDMIRVLGECREKLSMSDFDRPLIFDLY